MFDPGACDPSQGEIRQADLGMSSAEATAPRTLAEIVREVDPEAVAVRIFVTCRREVPGFARLPEDDLRGPFLAHALNLVETVRRGILQRREPTEPELRGIEESVQDAAGAGVSLEDILAGYRAAGLVCWEEVRKQIRDEDRQAEAVLSEVLVKWLDRFSSLVTRAYFGLASSGSLDQERPFRALLEALLGKEPLAIAVELSQQLGFPLPSEYRPIAARSLGASAGPQGRLAARLRSAGVLAVSEAGRVAGVTGAGMDGGLSQETRVTWSIGNVVDREDLSRALDQTRLLVDLGAAVDRAGPIHASEFILERLLLGSPSLADIARARVVEPLRSYQERRGIDLVKTLREFLNSDRRRVPAAERLHLHPNTLDNRVRRIEQLTGLRLSCPYDAALVTLAVLDEFPSAPPPPAGRA